MRYFPALIAVLTLPLATLPASAQRLMPGTFEAQVTGAVTARIKGAAVLRPHAQVVHGVPGSVVEMRFDNGVGGVLSLARPLPGIPAFGRYPVANLWDVFQSPSSRRMGILPQTAFAHFVFETDRPLVFLSEDGMLSITRSGPGFVEGTFVLNAAGADLTRTGADRIRLNVSGRFHATLEPGPEAPATPSAVGRF